MGPRLPDSQSVLEPTGRFVAHNVSEALKQIGVDRAAPLLENTIIGLRSDRRSRAQVAASWLPYLCDERCSPLLVGVFFVV